MPTLNVFRQSLRTKQRVEKPCTKSMAFWAKKKTKKKKKNQNKKIGSFTSRPKAKKSEQKERLFRIHAKKPERVRGQSFPEYTSRSLCGVC